MLARCSLRTMMLAVVLLGGEAGTYAASRDKLTNEPIGRIQFDTTLKDFGQVKRGQKLSTKFTFSNVGQGPLVIRGIQAACNCTAVDTVRGKTYAPKETGEIEVTFDSTDYVGKVVKAITVITNERAMPDRTLTISALVNSEIEADPPIADFGEVVLAKTPQLTIKIMPQKSDVKVEKLRFNEDVLTATLTQFGKEWVVNIGLKASAATGFFKDTIYVKNTSQALPELPIPVRASIKGPISLSPAYVEFGSVASGGKSTRQLDLSSAEGFEISASKAEVLVNGNKIENSAKIMSINQGSASGNQRKIALELSNPGGLSGSVHGKIQLETSNPSQKTLAVDFYAFFK